MHATIASFLGSYSLNIPAILNDVFSGNFSNLLFGNNPLGTLPFGL